MTNPKFAVWTSFALGLTLAACSNSGSDSSLISIQAAVQDLGADPDGMTTVITLASPISGLTGANFEADGGQSPVTVSTIGAAVSVVWDDRVTPAHRVRVINAQGVSAAYADVETSDDSEPTFTITDALQIAGLGDDVVTLQFSGPRPIEAEAEDLSNWSLEVSGESLSLAGSTFDLDTNTGVLTLVTGPDANLHAQFSLTALDIHSVADVGMSATAVVGVANGDSTAPALVSAEQNLAQDEFGRVIDFTFDEAMDPLFAASSANFTAASPDLALLVSQPTPEVLRVTFNNPIVPGVDQVTLSSLLDAHGNAMALQATAITAGSTVANDFDGSPELVTVANVGGDYFTVTFDQAIDPDDALDDAHWELSYDDGGGAVSIDLSLATLDYDLLTKTLTFQLANDYSNGADFTFSGLLGDPPLDVDGEAFTGSFTGLIAGDALAPSALTAVQRRNLDTWGRTLDIRFGEDLDESSAEDLNNWSVSGLTLQTATLIASRVVRLTVDDTAVPGDATIAISDVEDLAGNTIAAVAAMSFTSSDLREPQGVASLAQAIEGLENDTLFVTFDDRLIESEIENSLNWLFEAPAGVALDLSNAVVVYDVQARTATLTFGAGTGIDLQTDSDYSLSWSGVRDLGGNPISTTPLTGTIDAEVVLPTVVSAFVDAVAPNSLYVRFSEPCQKLDDIAGLTIFEIYDNTGLLKGVATNAFPEVGGLSVELVFGFALSAGADTLTLRGVQDAAGNPLFSITDVALETEFGAAPTLDTLQSTFSANSGERNDVIELVFDRPLSPWGLLDAALYDIELSGQDLDLSAASLEFDGASTVTIRLDGAGAPDLQVGQSYDVTVQGVHSAQGVAVNPVTIYSVLASGDVSSPTLPAGWARLDASSATDTLLVIFDEALETTSAENVGNYLLNGVTAPDSVELIDFRTVRCVFTGGVVVGDTLDFSGVADLAGNVGVGTRAVSAADVSGPVVVAAQAYSVPGAGRDYLSVQFNRPLDLSGALAPANWSLTMGAVTYDLTDARMSWASGSFSVVLELVEGQELVFGATVNIGAAGLTDVAGLALSPAASLNVVVQGDSTAPGFAAAFVNFRLSGAGTVVDVLFDEAVNETFALNALNWTVSGGPQVIGVERRSADFYRLELSTGLALGDSLELVALPDLAENLSGVISITPVH